MLKGSIILIIVAVFFSTLFAAKIPPMWTEFTMAIVVLIVAIILLRISTKKKLEKSDGNDYSITGFKPYLEKISKTIEELLVFKRSDSNSQSIENFEININPLLLQLDDYRISLTTSLGIVESTNLFTLFAKAERSINRSYSALVDQYNDEYMNSLNEAKKFINQTINEIEKIKKEDKAIG